MIRVSVEGKKHIEKIKILGHADYEDYGKDIVCSSVSSIVTTTVNGIYEIDNSYLRNVFVLEPSRVQYTAH